MGVRKARVGSHLAASTQVHRSRLAWSGLAGVVLTRCHYWRALKKSRDSADIAGRLGPVQKELRQSALRGSGTRSWRVPYKNRA